MYLLLGSGYHRIGGCMMKFFSFIKASWCSGVHSNFTCCLASKVSSFAIFCKIFNEFPIIAYQTKECTNLFGCDRCFSAVLLKIIILSRYAIMKLKSFKILVINSWKYAGACANLKGTLTYLYFLKGALNAVFSIEDLSKGIWYMVISCS